MDTAQNGKEMTQNYYLGGETNNSRNGWINSDQNKRAGGTETAAKQSPHGQYKDKNIS